MSVHNENQNTELVIPPFFKRWSILLRRRPNLLWDVRFWLGRISGRNPVLWNNVMEYERIHAFCKGRVHSEECRKPNAKIGRQPGSWRDES